MLALGTLDHGLFGQIDLSIGKNFLFLTLRLPSFLKIGQDMAIFIRWPKIYDRKVTD